MKTHELKKSAKKVILFFVAALTFGLFSEKSLAQNYPTGTHFDSTTKMNPNAPGQDMSTPNQWSKPSQKPDTSHMKGTKPKLSQTQINKIAGNDTKLGKDSKGRQLYKEVATGKQYYINDSGTKVYVK